MLTLVRRGVTFGFESAAYDIKDRNSDAVYTSIHTIKKTIRILNANVATVKTCVDDGRRDEFDPAHFPSGRDVVIAADVNAHHDLWDEDGARMDARGNSIAEWMDLKDMVALNTGEPTRFDSSGKGTAPDVTLCHAAIADRLEWRVGSDLSSDHRPLHVTVQIEEQKKTTKKTKPRPCMRKADWSLYREETDKRFSTKLRRISSVEVAAKRLNKIIKQAAKKAIPCVPPPKKTPKHGGVTRQKKS